MQRRSAAGILLVVLLIPCIWIAFGCDSSTSPSKQVRSVFDLTPRENSEAEAAALWLSGDLVAPTDLYEDLLDGYSRIRSAIGDSINELDHVVFVSPWMPGELLVKLTEDAIVELRRGEYHDLDSLNAYYRVAKIDTHMIDFIGWMHLFFEGRLHPERLAEAYSPVPSLLYAEPNGMWNNQADNYPWLIDGGISYLFRNGWGDCPSGCIYNQFWYFKVFEGVDDVEYLGTFVLREDPEPDWWPEARRAYDAKH
jgi:hypothetical protein